MATAQMSVNSSEPHAMREDGIVKACEPPLHDPADLSPRSGPSALLRRVPYMPIESNLSNDRSQPYVVEEVLFFS